MLFKQVYRGIQIQIRDTESNKSSDFFLNPFCIMLSCFYYRVALYLFMYCTNKIHFKLMLQTTLFRHFGWEIS